MTYKNKTIKKHARGNWFVRIRVNGKYISIYGRTKQECYEKLKVVADKVEQEKWLAKLAGITATPIAQTVAVAPTVPTVKAYTLQEWFDEWLATYKGNLRANSVNGYKVFFKHFAELGGLPLTDITSVMLARVLNEKQLCRQAKDGMKSMLKQMFSAAHNDKLIDSNPTLHLPRPKATPPVRARNALTAEQEQRFIETALADLAKYEPLLICLLQGVRKGEMLALRPNDLDFERNTLRIDESYDEQNPDDLLTKNADSNRKMPMFELTRKILLKYAKAEPTKRIYERVSAAQLYRRLAELQAKANLPKFTVHELRHTFITRCHEKKIDEMIVQRWVGHQIGSRMTKAVYTHISNDAEREFIELLNAKTA
ncbi:MAG: site-specific integrase [Firmicutes bacterium]|nr:site-specific integrase [Bacillota bacterium]